MTSTWPGPTYDAANSASPPSRGEEGSVLGRDREPAESVLHDEKRNPGERGRTGVECRRGILGLGRQDGELGHSVSVS